jgi:hypothetical protein
MRREKQEEYEAVLLEVYKRMSSNDLRLAYSQWLPLRKQCGKRAELRIKAICAELKARGEYTEED